MKNLISGGMLFVSACRRRMMSFKSAVIWDCDELSLFSANQLLTDRNGHYQSFLL